MRILAIRGSNLASLAGEFTVPFTEGPLGEAGIFAITGPTGAGKSTLLDAMSLALFDSIPRLAGAPASGQLSGDEFSPRDPRAILRHGAGEGHAELDFVARDGKAYRSRWSVRRARGKAEGKVQQASIDLKCLDTGERLGGRKRETLDEIERLIGLNAEQFGRAVVLAQGEFEAFIKASGDERAQLLEKLTGAAIYTLLGRKAFEKAKEVRSGYAEMQRDITNQEGLSDEERETVEDTIAEARIDRDAKAKKEELLQAAGRWTERLEDLTQKAATGRRARDETQQAVEEAAPREAALKRRKRALDHAGDWRRLADKQREAEQARKSLVERTKTERGAQEAETAAQIAEQEASAVLNNAKARRAEAEPELRKACEADRAMADAAKRCEEAAAVLASCLTAHEQLQTRAAEAEAAYEEARSKRAELEQWCENNAGLEQLAQEEAALSEDLISFAALRDRRKALEEERDKAEAEAENDKKTLDDAGKILAQADVDYEAAVKALERARKEAPDLDTLQGLDLERDILHEVQARQVSLQQAREREAEANSALANTRELIGKINDEQAERESRLAEIEAALPALEARKEESERNRTRVLAASDEGIIALREVLQDGEPCPVCGATEHRLGAFQAIFGEAVEEARARATETGEALNEARERKTVLKTEITSGAKNLAGAKSEAERQARLLIARASEREGCEVACAVTLKEADLDAVMSEDDLFTLLGERLPDLDAERERLRGAAGRLESARREEEEKRAARDRAREDRDLKWEAQRKTAETLADIDRKLEGNIAEQGRLDAVIDRMLNDLADWRRLPNPVDWLARRVLAWCRKEEEARSADARIPELFEQRAAHMAAAFTASRDLDSALARDIDAKAELDRTQSARKVLLGGRPVAEIEGELSASLELAEVTYKERMDKLGKAKTTLASARSWRESDEKALAALEAATAKIQETVEKALSATDLSAEEVAEAAETGPEALEREETELRRLHTALTEAKAAWAQREADLTTHKQTDPPGIDPETLATQLQEAKAAFDLAESALKEQEFRLQKDDDVRRHTATLRAALAEAQTNGRVWEELDDLIGDATGKTFRNFAQSLTLDRLLGFANDRLADLKPRYSLQRASGGDMLIEVIDNDMGGQVRGLQNLSGGERFLVSLALALGLAEMSTGRGVKIESLFIDEGFGALDSTSLGQAVAVLEHLQAQGRRVGVISHVEELKERIPVKVEVNPISGGRSEITISSD